MEINQNQNVLFQEIELVKSVLVLLPHNPTQTKLDTLKELLSKSLLGFTPNDSSLRDHVTILAPVNMSKDKANTREHQGKFHASIDKFFNFSGGLHLSFSGFYFHQNKLCIKLETRSNYFMKKIIEERGKYYAKHKSDNDPNMQLHLSIGNCINAKDRVNLDFLKSIKNNKDYAYIFSKRFHFEAAHFVKKMNEGAKFERWSGKQLRDW